MLGGGMGRHGRYGGGGYGMFGDPYGDDGINRNSFAPVSQRAMNALDSVSLPFLPVSHSFLPSLPFRVSLSSLFDAFTFTSWTLVHQSSPVAYNRSLLQAKSIFLDHLATVDVSKGEVSHEIIRFHLVPDMRKSFNRYVKEYGCTGTSRQITRTEQDLINKTRKSLLWFTSVKVTPEAQRAYLEKNPHLRKSTAGGSTTTASASTASSASASSASVKAPLQEVSAQKLKRQMNDAAVKHAASNPSHKKLQRKA
ncbi:hypothetical protein GALMADRAFT_142770 [Galerina marginata CBS 339.88]|uniref:Uncharacterized protein n=1 Tax=Galerina marginata (strain CBS 339.88) TaxID=685588 RepID=A0A067SQ64_GALM3|nr:hypothetical protein GALMADRAFT_142770 [Galerina marginata CBS 339.88]